jgi:hypothetical protein
MEADAGELLRGIVVTIKSLQKDSRLYLKKTVDQKDIKRYESRTEMRGIKQIG